MLQLKWQQLSDAERQNELARPALGNSQSLTNTVSDIISTVRQQGDQALSDYARAFDNIELSDFRVSAADIEAAAERVSEELKLAMADAAANIRRFHSAQQTEDISLETAPGVTCELRSRAIGAVGLYAPGGSAPLPSTVLMTAIPALVAGCQRIVLCSPPPIDDAVLFAAKLCAVDEVYQVGGAQAIAALAYGTESITKVDKIFGPGNRFVTEAKSQVALAIGGAAIDMPAGPSEVLVLADETANPAFIAADLLSQAEHGADSQAILVTPSQALADQVTTEVQSQLAQLSRQEIAAQAIEHSRIIISESLEEAIAISNHYAPEHLIIQTDDPREVLEKITAAGSVFLGAWSPESAGDYASGTNHVLPTYGMCNSYSSLSLSDFCKKFTVQELSASGLSGLARTICTLADAEGLDAHKRAVTIRMEQLECMAQLADTTQATDDNKGTTS